MHVSGRRSWKKWKFSLNLGKRKKVIRLIITYYMLYIIQKLLMS
jgi:hypothetical protein